MSTLSSLAAPQVVRITCGAASGDKVDLMKTVTIPYILSFITFRLGAPCIRNRSSSLTYKLITEEEAMAIASEPECNCDKGYQQCPMGAEGVPAPYITTREDDLLFDITNHSEGMEEYILRSHQEFTGLT